MALHFRVTEKSILVKGKKEKRACAQTVYRGEVTIDRLTGLISKISAISEGDVKSVLDTLSRLIAADLTDGRVVSLGDLGRMRLTVRAKSTDKAADFSVKQMRRPGIVFTPGKLIRSAITDARFESVTGQSTPDSGSKPQPTPGGGNTGADQDAGL